MMFAAMQQMSLPSNELKPLREIVDGLATTPEKLDLPDLCSLGSFFWDLSRSGVKHKGYRMQASRFGKAFCAAMGKVKKPAIDQRYIDCCCWAASHRFWPAGNNSEPPKWIQSLSSTEPRIAAAIVKWQLNETYGGYRLIDLKPEIALIQEAARNEKDPFYRFSFDKIVSDATAKTAAIEAEIEKRRSRSPYSFFDVDGDEDDDHEDDDDEDDEDDGDDVEDTCQCASCRARRRREQSSSASNKSRATPKPDRASSQPSLFGFNDDEFEDDDDNDDDENDDDEFDDDNVVVPPIAVKVFTKLGPAGAQELMELSQKPLARGDSIESERVRIESVRRLLLRNGISDRDASKFIDAIMYESPQGDEAVLDAAPVTTPVILSPEEIKANRKQREKELVNRMKQRSKKGNRS